ncbi:hypothetical protein JTB14_033866 [Gonioctena quinquepunctata]|nr:hypothetical protein JTB14_033866 [Gonioctena quinquepunctata]
MSQCQAYQKSHREMPKKFSGENTKAAAAREKKKQTKAEALTNKNRVSEDDHWKDEDKRLLKKQQKKEVGEMKRQGTLQRKAEVKACLQ